jgi:hypothetical protein
MTIRSFWRKGMDVVSPIIGATVAMKHISSLDAAGAYDRHIKKA